MAFMRLKRSAVKRAGPRAVTVTVHINAPLDFESLAGYFGQDLNKLLTRNKLAWRDDYGHSSVEPAAVTWRDLTWVASGDSAQLRRVLAHGLSQLGAPRGSTIAVEGSSVITEAGVMEGLSVRVDGRAIHEGAYFPTGARDLFEALSERMAEVEGRCYGAHVDADGALGYYYGPAFTRMAATAQRVLDAHPLGARSHIVKVA